MTVRELIERLQQFDSELQVKFYVDWAGYIEVGDVSEEPQSQYSARSVHLDV